MSSPATRPGDGGGEDGGGDHRRQPGFPRQLEIERDAEGEDDDETRQGEAVVEIAAGAVDELLGDDGEAQANIGEAGGKREGEDATRPTRRRDTRRRHDVCVGTPWPVVVVVRHLSRPLGFGAPPC